MELHILGIRHHGPGSANRLRQALEEIQPDVIAIELPDEKDAYEELLFTPSIQFPIALMISDAKALERNALLPFAEFSPEWKALYYAKENQIPIKKIDLPLSIGWQIKEEGNHRKKDHLFELAKYAGFSSFEAWWDHYFEREAQALSTFEQLFEIMKIAREGVVSKGLEAYREAYMRTSLRKLQKDFERIAVIVGAWHAPRLDETSLSAEKKKDQQRLKGWRVKKSNTAIIPYSYKRLSVAGGYGSGVKSPVYYDFLDRDRASSATYWLSYAAECLRKKGYNCSVDEVMAAVKLAEEMTNLRGLSISGLEELKDAALSCLCHGSASKWKVIEKQALIGDKIGYVPHEHINTPLIQDFQKKIKTYRISNYWRVESDWEQKELDLRKSKHLECSSFLHQLLILKIDWANKLDTNDRAHGSFKENWHFNWDIEHEIKLYESSIWGATVITAAEEKIADEISAAPELRESVQLLRLAIKGNCTQAIPQLLDYLNSSSAHSEDLVQLLQANGELLQYALYDLIHKTPKEILSPVIERIHHKICHLLPFQNSKLEDEASVEMLKQLEHYHQLIMQSDQLLWMDVWKYAIAMTLGIEDNDARFQGLMFRIALDFEIIDGQMAHDKLMQHLNSTYEPLDQAAWLEGFLTGGAMVFLYHPSIFEAIRNWVKDIEEQGFRAILPVLNRLFSTYSERDRMRIMQKVLNQDINEDENPQTNQDLQDWAEKHLQGALQLIFEDEL